MTAGGLRGSGSSPRAVEQAVEALGVGRARVDAELDTPGNDIGGAGLDLERPDRRDRALDARGGVANAEDELGRLGERVVPGRHRRRARMSGGAFKDNLTARVADDPGHDAERGAGPLEHRPLLDVHLDEAAGKRPALDEGPTTHAPTLLVPEHDHPECSLAGTRRSRSPRARRRHRASPSNFPPAGTLSRCEPVQTSGSSGCDPSRRPTTFPAGSHSTSRPASSIHAAATSTRLLLRIAAADSIRAAAAAQGVQLVEPLECPFRCRLRVHRRVLQHSGSLVPRRRNLVHA